MGELKEKTVSGLRWVGLSIFSTRVLHFVTSIILARLLSPADFGIIAIGFLIIQVLEMFRDLGIGQAIIYKKDEIEKTADTAFILTPIIGISLFALGYLIAPLIAIFFKNASLAPVVKLLALTIVLSSLEVVPSFLLEKELRFKKKVIAEILPTVGYTGVAISLAYLGYGLWSIVYGHVVYKIMSLILIWYISSWRPKFQFNKAISKELLNYGKYIIGSWLLIFIYTHIDSIFIGKILEASALGLYAMAFNIANLPATNITQLVNRVMFPAFSKIQEDKKFYKVTYLKVFKCISIIVIPLSLGTFVIAEDFIKIILGEKWQEAIIPLQVLSFYGLFRALSGTTGNIFMSTGQPKILQRVVMLQLIICLPLLYHTTKFYGIFGISLVMVGSLGIGLIYALKKVSNILEIKPWEYLNCLKQPLIFSLISIFLIKLIYCLTVISINIYSLSIFVVLVIISYFSLVFIFEKKYFQEILSIFGIGKKI
ncbi:lipopolysaccharide biosynthesis protein [bacterium]|nr:lipopolysaccharide biosynthesis protein [bacterium]MBU1782440.1 lipopolysaccharide biosynthesis protein [bacterium]MBU2599875.1 lipopolysaccharide biosynthesis protein [bacterium]